MLILLFSISIILTIVVFIPATGIRHYYVSGHDYLKGYYFSLGLILLLLSLPIFENSFLWKINFLLIVVNLFVTGRKVYRYTFLGSKAIPDADKESETETLKLIIYNVYQPNKNFSSFLELVSMYDPDLLFLVETDGHWKEGLNSLEKKYPFRLYQIQDDTYGLMCLSKKEFLDSEIMFQVKENIPSASILIESGSHKVRVYGIHPEPPAPDEAETALPKDKELLTTAYRVKKDLENGEIPIVIGDLNDVAWSNTSIIFKNITGLKDPREGRGFYSTFPSYFYFKIPLDHIFCHPCFSLVDFKTLDNIGSDHLPIYAAFKVRQ